MNTAQHIVLDLETLSTKPNAVVLSIGAVALDYAGQFVSEFHVALDDAQGQPGRDVDEDTVAWWGEQSDEAKAASLNADDYVSATIGMCRFSAWLCACAEYETVKVWGNGSSFDNAILSSLYAQCHELRYPLPWKYWNERDLRTILDVFPEARHVGEFEGIKHHALHDARHEAKQLAKALSMQAVQSQAAPAAASGPSDARPYRTEAEIVEQTVALTKYLLDWKWGLTPEGDTSRIWESKNTKAQVCWNAACHIQDLLTQTDVWNAVENIDGEEAAASKAAPAAAAGGRA